MNIILVIFDSLRKDCVGAFGSPPWGKVYTPHFDAFAKESVLFTRVYPESLPTLPARRAIYTGERVYPYHEGDIKLKGDFKGAPGWGPIPEEQDTLAELLKDAGYRTGLIADVYHMFKPSKNFWRGFDQWKFLRGQEKDPQRSGPDIPREEMDRWVPRKIQTEWNYEFIKQFLRNMHDRTKEEDYFGPRVLKESALWLEQNQDADKLFLTIESFDPHEPWLVPRHYLKMYTDPDKGDEQVMTHYRMLSEADKEIIRRTQMNYSAEVTMCDRWFGYFIETVRVLGMLDNTAVIFTTDHGHSLGDRNYLGKRGYPSSPEVCDVPLMIRLPGAKHAGKKSDMFISHTDINAEIRRLAGLKVPKGIDGRAFLDDAIAGKKGTRDHVTIGWGSAVTVVDKKWWLNCKVDGTGVFLHDLTAKNPFSKNVADQNKDIVKKLFSMALKDAGGSFPKWLVKIAKDQSDAPGCSDLAARK